MTLKAYAKINLRLKVLGITENSYHLLQMVNAKIGLYDKIVIKKNRQKTIDIDMPYVEKEDNLIYKVAKKMFDLYNLPGGIYIKVKKNIPLGSGLAGGSSDAAVVIKAINRIYKLDLTKEDLRKIAIEFGTDIVYCLDNRLAFVEGIGEHITLLNKKVQSDVLIINPNFSVLTKDIFNSFDENGVYSKSLSIDAIEKINIEDMLENDLEETTFRLYPVVKTVKEEIKNRGFNKVLMTGTGPTLFVLGNKKELKKLYKIYNTKYKTYLTKIINKYEE